MRQGSTLIEMATEIQRQTTTKKDFVSPAPLILVHPWDKHKMPEVADGMQMELSGQGNYGILPYSHGQIASVTGIPKEYYDRMRRENPQLAAFNVNEWLHADKKGKHMIRVLDGKVRGVLSDTYRPLENVDLAEMALPLLAEHKLDIWSSALTDTRLYIKGTSPKLVGEVRKGEVVHGGVCIRNSEVGHGAVAIEFFTGVLVCLNGMIAETTMRRNHVGKKALFEGEGVAEFYKDDTKQAEDKAVFLKFRDALNGLLNGGRFEKFLEEARGAAEQGIKKPLEVVELTAKRLGLQVSEKESVLQHFIEGGDLSRWGLANAVTQTATDATTYERATELERAGYTVIELPRHEWELIAA